MPVPDKSILYYSTNASVEGSGRPLQKVGFRDALFMGQAPDEGLFMPDCLPLIDRDMILGLRDKPYSRVAYDILRLFLHDEVDDSDLLRIVEHVYDFDVPIEKLDEETFLLRLDQGPTASFKDFAARMMAELMKCLKPACGKTTILVATSGDTGSAIGEAYRELEGFDVRIIYPRDEVSSIQRQQLDTIGANVRSAAVDGKFDDCQRLVKQAFSDPDLAGLNLTSANSINIGRILPQIVYYFYAYANIAENFEPVIFSVPSGNFGNSLGCEFARRMGLPVERLVIATNANDEFPEFLKSGAYRKVDPARACLSNAMNVGNPSNLARYFNLYGGHIDKEGIVHSVPDVDEMRRHLYSISISDEETLATINEVYRRYDSIIEPHGAVGFAALSRLDRAGRKSICLETAAPGKFADLIKRELGVEPFFSDHMRDVLTKKGQCDHIGKDYDGFKKYLLETLLK